MKRLLAYLFLVLGLGLLFNGFALADLTFVSWGGAYTASQQKAYINTWSKGSRVTIENYNGGLEEIKAQVNSGNVKWDVVDVLADQAITGCDEGLFEKIPQDQEMINDMIVAPLSDCVVPQIFWSYVVFFDKKTFPGKKPKTIKDFFDVKKFPGKRGVNTWANGIVEMALVADGVKPSKVYEVLSTSKGVERAFRQLDKIRDHVVFWSAGSEPLMLVASGEVVMSIAYNGRVGAAILQEGRNFEYLWDAQVLEQEYLAMLKGTKNKREALEFMKHASSAKSLALQAKYIPYGPMRKSSIDIIKRGEPWFNTGENITKHINSRPKLLKKSVLANPFWWADNGYYIYEIFSNWKDGGSYGSAQTTLAKQISKPSKTLVTKVFEKPDEEKKIVSKKPKIETLDQMYADGLLTKDECLKAKRIVLGDDSQVSCGETEEEPTVTYITKKKKPNQIPKGAAILQFEGHIWNGKIVSKKYYCIEAFKAGMQNWANDLFKKKGCSKTTIIAKKEPSQTQEVAEKNTEYLDLSFCEIITKPKEIGDGYYKEYQPIGYIRPILNDAYSKCASYEKKHTDYKFYKNFINWFKQTSNQKFKIEDPIICYAVSRKSVFAENNGSCEDKKSIKFKKVKYDGKNFYIGDTPKTQIAKKEPSQTQEVAEKEKKKKKVAKVVKQKEYTPTKVDKDTDPPVLKIAEIVTVNNPDYTLNLEVSDKGSKKLYVEVDGVVSRVTDKKGKFIVKRYSPVDEEVKITVIDQWGNKTSKIVKVKVEIEETEIVKKLEMLNPTNIRAKSSGNNVAIVIGIENYDQAPKANYANLDAKYFFEYAQRVFGVKKQNINLLIDEDASLIKTYSALSKWLPSKIKPNQTDLIIFFAGHGLASNNGKELYLLSQDSDVDLLSRTALSRTELFADIISLKPKSVTMFLDTCYSGVSRDEQMLLASARPIRIVADDEGEIPNNFTIFSASQLDQISSGLKEAKHGIFSYYLMKGLEGKADSNKDKQITNGELLAYMDQNISQKALELGRQQNPSLAGDPNKVLMKY